jgi:phosphohistidine phosphatase SixA
LNARRLLENGRFVAAEIYIFRHGIEATTPDPPGLSDQGLARVRRQARALSWMGVRFDVILSGHATVCRQTADVLAEVMSPIPQIIETPALGSDGNADAALREIWSTQPDIRIAVVGTEPIVGVLAAKLIGARYPLKFKKAAACRIDVVDPGACGSLRWFLPPRILREIGRWA